MILKITILEKKNRKLIGLKDNNNKYNNVICEFIKQIKKTIKNYNEMSFYFKKFETKKKRI